ncbi:hypothetical protein MAXJ12_08379 [Mesorhizobium alhagi CCNWXJ12-2]|uniref:Uncharacterized protein n=1 Tax=Mesorhizobium alhagi CCNWXJ12-2 TaxID=1107882 RepID=H0HNF3_9HYPH|nr:hypothetical protein MAXJ12_08379 [Mesorhizobium alhagi CCNWXJ12-2]
MEAARAEVSRLEREAAAATCAEIGHSWKSIGGCNAACENIDCGCSVPVHECEVCGDCDYGQNAEADEVKRTCTEQMMLDEPDYENRACDVCGAKTDDEAGKLCKSYQLPSGDYACNGSPEDESYPDGRLRFLSEVGIAGINAWVDEMVAAHEKTATDSPTETE